MKPVQVSSVMSRRTLLHAGVLAPPLLSAVPAGAALSPPPYTISINIEIMFGRGQSAKPKSRADRIKFVAAHGLTAYGFWRASEEEQQAMLLAQKETGLKCSSVIGSGSVQENPLTKADSQEQYLAELLEGVKVAQKFGGADAITFVGEWQKDSPLEKQRETLVKGLRAAGAIAQDHGVYLVLEPLSRIGNPSLAINTAESAFSIVEEVAHPHVRVDFDIYHLQLGEGNITNNLKLGLEKGWIRIVQIGDVPGRKEPGSGEINYPHIFRTLREVGYSGYLDTEHGTTSTPEHAIEVVKKMSLEY